MFVFNYILYLLLCCSTFLLSYYFNFFDSNLYDMHDRVFDLIGQDLDAQFVSLVLELFELVQLGVFPFDIGTVFVAEHLVAQCASLSLIFIEINFYGNFMQVITESSCDACVIALSDSSELLFELELHSAIYLVAN